METKGATFHIPVLIAYPLIAKMDKEIAELKQTIREKEQVLREYEKYDMF